MKISNKISLLVIGSILLIANAIPIGRYLDEKQKIDNTFKTSAVSKEVKSSDITKPIVVNQQTIGKTMTPSMSFTKIGPTTNLKIKLTGPGSLWGISGFSYFLKYQTWTRKSDLINGFTMTKWTAVDHQATIGGSDVKNIEVAGTKIADTEVRVKSSGKGWAKMITNKDLKWPKGLDPTLAATTYSIDSIGSRCNPSISFSYHIKGYGKLTVASYAVYNFLQWTKDHLFAVIMGIIVVCAIIISIVAIIASGGVDVGAVAAADAAIAEALLMAEASALYASELPSVFEMAGALAELGAV